MEITFNHVERILKTLPIGYYIKRDVKTTLVEDDNCSSYNPMTDEIRISFKQLSKAFDDSIDTEETVRTMLYHEVSHAFLTPNTLCVSRCINIFEDERIETLLRDFYMNINFKSLVKRVNHFKGEAPKTADEAFYQLVRYRIGESKWLNRVSELITKFKDLNAKTENAMMINEYARQITRLYDEFCREFNSTMHKQSEEEIEDKEESAESGESTDFDEVEPFNSKNDSTDAKLTADEFEHVVKNLATKFYDKSMTDRIDAILQRATNNEKRNGSAINAYSGIFDVRSTCRDDYKFFVQKNRSGHVKAYSKIHLNLFIDCSGSFWGSEDVVNKLLYALTQFEKKNSDFTYDLITCGMGEKLHAKDERVLHCYGGNDLDSKIFDLFKKMQFANCVNKNIVLFDGDAFTDSCDSSPETHFAAFDNAHTMIISDGSNALAINKYCKSSKSIITKEYAKELCKNVLATLDCLFR